MDHNKLWTIFKVMGILDRLTYLLRNLKKQQLELNIEQQTGSKLGKEHFKSVHCPTAYLSSLQSTSCKRLGLMNNKLESRLLGELSTNTQIPL